MQSISKLKYLLGRRKKNVKNKTAAVSAFDAKKALEKESGLNLYRNEDLNLMSMIILILVMLHISYTFNSNIISTFSYKQSIFQDVS